jgi:hypothetical protein
VLGHATDVIELADESVPGHKLGGIACFGNGLFAEDAGVTSGNIERFGFDLPAARGQKHDQANEQDGSQKPFHG